MKASSAMDCHLGRASKYSPMVGAVRGNGAILVCCAES